ncbi:pentatricopeptide repeat-containing protein At2g36980, mitochondrial-like isoform X1 [Asparagus officinalis]|uniref:pentatricopeptide repeat-containing protein At2g36980, mitochondrial-like isoform X1 n=1 Tax=Asparagus officinalis TaxID=4686 RepID=UPI00098E0C4E|nr:pentatricopeptide repeat-containing protein At2g36980, mitochondrial-like isoform X1 [Asparagus officinalis]
MPPPSFVLTTNKILSLARSGLIASARRLFDEMPERDTISWNAMLTAYCNSNLPDKTLSLFSSMISSSAAKPDHFTLTAALSAASDARELRTGTQLHSFSLRSGFNSLPVTNSIVDMYGKCSCPCDAERVFESMEERNVVSWCCLIHGFAYSGILEKAHQLFDEMPSKNTVAWNVLIMGCTLCNEPEMSMGLFRKMLVLGFEADALTFSGVMNACAEIDRPCFGETIHSLVVKIGWIDAVEVSNSILSFYSVFGLKNDAVKIFEAMRMRSQVSWNAMIDAFMKGGDVDEAISLFRKAPKKSIISWTSIVSGFARNRQGEEAVMAFVNMMKNYFRPDDFAFGAVLHACAILAVIGYGKMIHSSIIKSGFGSFVYVENGLLNMYAKCGDIEDANIVFNGIQLKDVVSWNMMILGFALHGCTSKAFEIYNEMVASDVVPDKVTFLGLLMACNHSGLIEKGGEFFDVMKSVYGISPDMDHFTCIIDMLGRSGHLKDANKLIEKFSGSSEALLSVCTNIDNFRVSKKIGEELVRIEPEKDTGYVMLSNSYCASGQWIEAERVRKEMVEQGVKKAPGCSWIEVRDIVKVFMSGSRSVVDMLDVHEMLWCLESEMRDPGFIFS